MNIEHVLFELTEALRYPVLALTLLCLVLVAADLGVLFGEVRRRRHRGVTKVEGILDETGAALAEGDSGRALTTIREAAFSPAMAVVLDAMVTMRHRPDAADRVAKRLAEFDLRSMQRLERSRILVRFGPALGLMGTLIPLSPALAGLSGGDVERLTENLRVAFGVTVVGLLVGAVAFTVSLVRDRMYAHDFSDLEFAAAQLVPERPA